MKTILTLLTFILLSCNSFKQNPEQLFGTWEIDKITLKESLEKDARKRYPNNVEEQQNYVSKLYDFSVDEEWTFNEQGGYQKTHKDELLAKGIYKVIEKGNKFLKIRTYPEYIKHYTKSEIKEINQLSEEQLFNEAQKGKINYYTFIIGVEFTDNQTCKFFHYTIKDNKNTIVRMYGISSVYKKKKSNKSLE